MLVRSVWDGAVYDATYPRFFELDAAGAGGATARFDRVMRTTLDLAAMDAEIARRGIGAAIAAEIAAIGTRGDYPNDLNDPGPDPQPTPAMQPVAPQAGPLPTAGAAPAGPAAVAKPTFVAVAGTGDPWVDGNAATTPFVVDAGDLPFVRHAGIVYLFVAGPGTYGTAAGGTPLTPAMFQRLGGTGDFLADGTVKAAGDFDMGGHEIANVVVDAGNA